MRDPVLIGADDVSRAGRTLRSAAETMQQAAAELDDTLHRHRLFLDDWLMRFEYALERQSSPVEEPDDE